ncbi:MAG TPA: winged helix-turn-helix domain-containing protein [Ktedonobacterales bacterium]|jgi:DNA-binding response OmpR family regulator
MGAPPSDHETSTAPPASAPSADPARPSVPPTVSTTHAEDLARAGHALKSPLAVIKGSATTLLASQWDAATQQELLTLIDAQADDLLRQLNALLELWSREAAQVALHPVSAQHVASADELIGAPPALASTAPPDLSDPHDQHARPVVVVAERDAHLARLVRATLDERGYRVLLADDARRLGRLLDQEDPDLVLLDARLDARLSDAAGGALAPVLRGPGSVPVIVLGAGTEAECVRALDHGAHDYLGRPFGLGELLARVRAALRAGAREQHPAVPEPPFRSGDLAIDYAQRLVRMGERTVPLSRTEFKLLRELARHAGRVLAHEQLLERVWGPGYGQEVEFLWVYVRRLRRKIEPDPRHPCYILTVPGVGYRLAQL